MEPPLDIIISNITQLQSKNLNNSPVISFGTRLSLDNAVFLDGISIFKSQFTVTDTGGSGTSAHWINIYYGPDYTINRLNALKFCNAKKVFYRATYLGI